MANCSVDLLRTAIPDDDAPAPNNRGGLLVALCRLPCGVRHLERVRRLVEEEDEDEAGEDAEDGSRQEGNVQESITAVHHQRAKQGGEPRDERGGAQNNVP